MADEFITKEQARVFQNASFPQVLDDCPTCYGTGEVDISRHGSPNWKMCETCKGEKLISRRMTTEEKVGYLGHLHSRKLFEL